MMIFHLAVIHQIVGNLYLLPWMMLNEVDQMESDTLKNVSEINSNQLLKEAT